MGIEIQTACRASLILPVSDEFPAAGGENPSLSIRISLSLVESYKFHRLNSTYLLSNYKSIRITQLICSPSACGMITQWSSTVLAIS